MRVGSLVECISNNWVDKENAAKAISIGYKTPIVGEVYTIREILENGRDAILLEEIINRPVLHARLNIIAELGFNKKHFREVQPPMDLSFIEELQQTQTA